MKEKLPLVQPQVLWLWNGQRVTARDRSEKVLQNADDSLNDRQITSVAVNRGHCLNRQHRDDNERQHEGFDWLGTHKSS
jgi:hypothetical protein